MRHLPARLLITLLAVSGLSCAAERGTVLFVCTGNYYRSRFAEAVFNFKARQRGLSWTAFSRGLNPTAKRPDNLSPFAVQELRRLGIPLERPAASPRRLGEQDLRQARIVVALDRVEHEPMLRAAFPAFDLSRLVFWNVKDIPLMSPDVALPIIVREIDALIARLAADRR